MAVWAQHGIRAALQNQRWETLGLIIAGSGVKPAVAMKTQFRIFAFVVFAVIAVAAILSCQNQLQYANRRPECRIGDPEASPTPIYRELKKPLPQGETDFRNALTILKSNGGDCEIYFLRHPGEDPEFNYCDKISVKTHKVTKSEAAKHSVGNESAGNDPHATYRVASPHQVDIDRVIATLK